MTTIGPYYSGQEQIGTIKMSDEYVNTHKKRKHFPGPMNRVENY